MKNLTRALKAEAYKLGFNPVGVTTPDPPRHLSVYRAWLEAGRHADMGWMAAERALRRRADPRLILPECRSILVMGVPYPPPISPLRGGRISSYAWNRDYHDVIPERLKRLVTYLENLLGTMVPNRWYTDTGPILERELAQRAGLGWIGKNTCLIHPRRGSFMFLAEILLGVELEPDPPFTEDLCGSCTRCVDACPTSCILPDRTIDARRCVSYLTIENKAHIPPHLREGIGNWLFGCDICQEVCPWNVRFADDSGAWEEFLPREPLKDPDPGQELLLDEGKFREKFGGSPVKRTKRRGYLRNAAVVCGNQGDLESIPRLTTALRDQEALIRTHAAWALGQIKTRESQRVLASALESETDPWVMAEIQAALRHLEESSG